MTELPDIRSLISLLDKKLIYFLSSLKKDDWQKQTIAKLWKVKDVAAHLLDGNLRGISFGRDSLELSDEKPINSYEELVSYLNELNADWVKAAKRISPELLIELLESTNKEYYNYLTTLDLDAKAIFPVSWAGEYESDNRFHIAREYTEKWIHQQQIRSAFDNREIMTKEFFLPMMDTLLCGLPHLFRDTKAENETALKIVITGDEGGEWFLKKENEKWILLKSAATKLSSDIIIKSDAAWKLFSKSIRYEDVKDEIKISGDKELAMKALMLVAVMA